jgi:hypothetical protein
MSSTPSGVPVKKPLTRRSFLSFAGGAAGVAAAGKLVSGELRTGSHGKEVLATAANAAPVSQKVRTITARRTLDKPVAAGKTLSDSLPAADEGVLTMFAALPPGTKLGRWKIASVHGVQMGAVPVVMEDRKGDRFQVDVCARDGVAGAPRAVADAGGLSFFLANNGTGGTPSDESHGLGVIALAAAMEKVARKSAIPAVPGMMTLRERLAAFPDGAYAVHV